MSSRAVLSKVMLYQGQAIQLSELENDCVELSYNLTGESVNKFNALTLKELDEVLALLKQRSSTKGMLVSSGKEVFIVGADIAEFGPKFAAGEEVVRSFLAEVNALFNAIEELPFPSVVAINGYALGGGLELCLSCDYRLLSEKAKIGLPETKLGIIPGWGGTVRLPRLAGVDVAVEWIASGKEYDAKTALKAGVVDGVIAHDQLRESALLTLQSLVDGKLEYQQRRTQKQSPLPINDTESLLSFESSKAFVAGQAGRHYPAPVAAIKSMQEGAKLNRDEALAIETTRFVKMAMTPVADSLVGLFLSDQSITKTAKQWAAKVEQPISKAAVLGAGIMGGGIAYQSAYKGVPVLMKDIAQSGLDLGMQEAIKLLNKRVERGRMSAGDMATTVARITPSLTYDSFSDVDILVEAVVENANVKKSVLAEAEKHIADNAVLCSNTSTISIDELALSLQRPENFCGMHFFNPVHAMPLVEVIRGKASSDQTIAKTVAYANALGKKAIVVNDCPGFLVNRVLFPYLAGFLMLVRDGADFQHIDKVMEAWGWPMGPAYLLDVVGIDTGIHAESVMGAGFPDRMTRTFKAASEVLFDAKRFGQKSGAGFYRYEKDKKGKLKKQADPAVYDLLKDHCAAQHDFSDEEILARMMIPMATELARCLEEGIVGSVEEADMALIYGLGFPPFRGGLFRWIDSVGIDTFLDMTNAHTSLSPLYDPTDEMQQRAKNGSTYYVNKTHLNKVPSSKA